MLCAVITITEDDDGVTPQKPKCWLCGNLYTSYIRTMRMERGEDETTE